MKYLNDLPSITYNKYSTKLWGDIGKKENMIWENNDTIKIKDIY